MIEKALTIVIFLYATGGGILISQYIFADVYGITLTSPVTGQSLKPQLLNVINIGSINTYEQNMTSYTHDQIKQNYTGNAAAIAWELLTLITGTYVFNVLYLLGVPALVIAIMVMIYFMYLARAIFGYIRGL